jgi:hypothetical protein
VGDGNSVTQLVPLASNDAVWVDLDSDNDGYEDLFISGQLLMAFEMDNARNSDVEFLKKVLHDVRGTPPTMLEEKYFSEDKEPKKREKLLDTLLKDPTVAKKLGDDWKKKMLEAQSKPFQNATQSWREVFEGGKLTIIPPPGNPQTLQQQPRLTWKVQDSRVAPANPKAPQPPADPAKPGFEWQLVPAAPKSPQPPADPVKPGIEWQVVPAAPKALQPPTQPRRVIIEEEVVKVPTNQKNLQQPMHGSSRLEKLVGELLAAKKTDAEMLEAVTLATVSRLPTEIEKRLTLSLVTKAGDRSAAWIEVAKALAATDEAPKAAVSGVRFTPNKIEVVPVPPAKP